jgi:hypothetical protein
MTDLLDRRLTEAGRRWQAGQPPPPEVPLARLSHAGTGRGWWRPAVAAAVAVVVATAAVVALTHRTGSDSATPTTRRTADRTFPFAVPWEPLPAGHPDIRHRVHGHVVTPYDDVLAYGGISFVANPGDTLVFFVTLRSSQDLPLAPCPDYSIAFGAHSSRSYQLNCSKVPYRDGVGRPYLPANKNVNFTMQVTVPNEPGRQKVLWTLDGPQSSPGFYGIVNVR